MFMKMFPVQVWPTSVFSVYFKVELEISSLDTSALACKMFLACPKQIIIYKGQFMLESPEIPDTE